MAKSNAERQAAYRARYLNNEQRKMERLNLVVDLETKRRIERLATCYGVTKRGLLERLTVQAECDALNEAAHWETGQADYFKGLLRLHETVVIGLQTDKATRTQTEES